MLDEPLPDFSKPFEDDRLEAYIQSEILRTCPRDEVLPIMEYGVRKRFWLDREGRNHVLEALNH